MAHQISDEKKRGPDGAPPGAEVPPTAADKHAFDADSRAETREQAPVTIGGAEYHRRRKNWEVTRALRTLLRRQERGGQKAARLRARIDALTTEIRGVQDPKTGAWTRPPIDDDARIDAIEEQVLALEAQIDDATDDSDQAAYELIALLLRDADGKSPDVDAVLKEHLDVEEAGDLAAILAGGGEPDPTPTDPSS